MKRKANSDAVFLICKNPAYKAGCVWVCGRGGWEGFLQNQLTKILTAKSVAKAIVKKRSALKKTRA